VKHHYIPAFYLRSFVDAACPAEYEPYLVVDLDTGKIRRQSPDNTAALTDYYAVGDGDSRYDVEKYLSEVESKTAHTRATSTVGVSRRRESRAQTERFGGGVRRQDARERWSE
jgi:Protein of unknown function (DUF4238)